MTLIYAYIQETITTIDMMDISVTPKISSVSLYVFISKL